MLRPLLVALVAGAAACQGANQRPNVMFGTAWKNERTAELTRAALQLGFRAIDTANQPKHYNEPAVGQAVDEFLSSQSQLTRTDLFLQSKFTFPEHQDPERVPYDRTLSVEQQVLMSFNQSLVNLRTTYLDAFLVHGPLQARSLTAKLDWPVWRTLEGLKRANQVRHIGFSNLDVWQLRELIAGAEIQPDFVQVRLQAKKDNWSASLRRLCARKGITLQAYGVISNNRYVLRDAAAQNVAKHLRLTPAQLVHAFVLQLGPVMLLTGTQHRHQLEETLTLARQLPELPPHVMEALEHIGPPGLDADESQAVSVRFVSDADVPLRAFWVNGKDRVENGELAPAGSLALETYSSHAFEFADPTGKVVFTWTAQASQGHQQRVRVPDTPQRHEEL